MGRTPRSQCAGSNGWSGHDQVVRHPRTRCRLARVGNGNIDVTRPRLPLCAFSSDSCASPSGALWPLFLASPHLLPFLLSLPLDFPCERAGCPVLRPFRSLDQGLALPQSRCAIRGHFCPIEEAVVFAPHHKGQICQIVNDRPIAILAIETDEGH